MDRLRVPVCHTPDLDHDHLQDQHHDRYLMEVVLSKDDQVLVFRDIKRACTLYAYHRKATHVIDDIKTLKNKGDACAYMVALFPLGEQKKLHGFLITKKGKEYLDQLIAWN